ncbi:GGDEF domain-containing protein [Paracidovorax wautersii]|uniref:diguanylate cyclase n=1 Tax=Paracidovorax wautersii TaxID=1177982 RepID=A0A1I1ZF24_9BURK|nr:GGDEF domain-containing protein [Paracidovorax wautersii]SFE30346.1 diguanylate cyclase (GGDEF) domain-containing protein [Paracidovorax wautersii]
MHPTEEAPSGRSLTLASAGVRALRDFCWAAAVVVPCALLAALMTRLLGPLSLFWPANAVLLGMLLRHPERASPAGWLGAYAGFLGADLLAGTSLPMTLWLNTANMAGVAAGYLVASRVLPPNVRNLRQPRTILSVLIVCLASATAGAIVGGAASPALFGRSLLAGLVDWFNGDLALYILLLPVMLAAPRTHHLSWHLLARRVRTLRWDWPTVLPVISLALSLVIAILVGGPGVLALPVPALIWCALRYAVFPTLALTALLSVIQLFSIAASLMVLPEGKLLYMNSVQSARLGIALIALGPMAVAIVNGARNDLLRRLDHMARHDHLTGVLRRGSFMEHGSTMLARNAAAGRPTAVLMIDIDHFKQINDRFGHAQGDRALATVAVELLAGLREGDILGRIGGEEFAALLPDTDARQAALAAERLRARVEAIAEPEEAVRALRLQPLPRLTASFGVAVCHAATPLTLHDLLTRADGALYQAKAGGRNRVELAGPARETTA